MSLSKLDVHGRWFIDQAGRCVTLRGVNLGGDSKVPYPDGGTDRPTDFSDHRSVSFIGRPFPLEEAHEHFTRLARWGFNCLRLLTTWEAVEHAGPGEYDTAYLDYFAEICRLAGEHGFHVLVDFHQDVWSRMSGGCGAPGWTFEECGLDFTKFHAAGAAHVMQYEYDYARRGRQGERYPPMSWSRNYRLPANGLMWTFFLAGRDMAPTHRVRGKNVQDFLQDSFLGAMRQVALRVADMPHVMGFDTLNEPSYGWLGQQIDYRHETPTAAHPEPVWPGPAISPLCALLLARGIARELPIYEFDAQVRRAVRRGVQLWNPDGVSIWKPGVRCPFEAAGAYGLAGGTHVLRRDYFTRVGGRVVDVERDYLLPFFQRVAGTIREVRADWLVFAEINPFSPFSGRNFPDDMPQRCVNANHWYDLYTLRSNTFEYSGDREAHVERYVSQLARVEQAAHHLDPAGTPTLIGEFGIPFDLDEGAAYAAWGSGDRSEGPWTKHVLAQTLMYEAMDRLQLNCTQWNYTVSNRNDSAIGDGWNQEDLSIYSRDQASAPDDPDSGGRAVTGFSRPYARAVQGEPRSCAFDVAEKRFRLVFDADPTVSAPTEIFVPRVHFATGFSVEAPGCTVHRLGDSLIHVSARDPGEHTVTVRCAFHETSNGETPCADYLQRRWEAR
jgi:hypothetical protein